MATRIQRFYTERQNLRPGSSVKLDGDEAAHIRDSLRMLPGDPIVLFNGHNDYSAKLTLVRRDAVMAEVIELVGEANVGVDFKITLYQSLIRPTPFEFVIQKATELGVSDIVPIATDFGQIKLPVHENKQLRWQKIAKEACKQSERTSVVTIHEPIKFADAISQAASDQPSSPDGQAAYLMTLARQSDLDISLITEIADEVKQAAHVSIFIGPEGGFSPAEHQLAAEQGIKLVSLGDLVLKSETAAIAALSMLNYQRLEI